MTDPLTDRPAHGGYPNARRRRHRRPPIRVQIQPGSGAGLDSLGSWGGPPSAPGPSGMAIMIERHRRIDEEDAALIARARAIATQPARNRYR